MALHASLPSRKEIEAICKVCSQMKLSHEMLTLPYTVLEQNSLKSPEYLLAIPGPNVHPAFIARYMLHLATFLQHPHPIVHEMTNTRAMSQRLAENAIGLATTKDELLGSIEGLECVMLESLYQANAGNLRRSWVAIRRAMVIAQLMGLHRAGGRAQYRFLDPSTKSDPQHMWFRIVSFDRNLCLMLGLPQGSLDRSMASDVKLKNDTPIGRLERYVFDII